MPRLRTILAGLLGAVAGGAIYQTLAAERDSLNVPPPGQLIDVGGHQLHYLVMGEGSPTVIIEAGLAGPGLLYYAVQREIAEFTRVVTYDRPGLGWSEPGPAPMDGERVVTDLHALLHHAGLPGPYVMVGHSWGGPYVRLFTHHYPEEVAGLVLVDASHEEQFDRFPPAVRRQTELATQTWRVAEWAARLGIMRLVSAIMNLFGVWTRVPLAIRPQARALLSRVEHWEGAYAEARDSHLTAHQVQAIGRDNYPLGDRPVIVLTAGATWKSGGMGAPGVSLEEMHRYWLEFQTEQAQLSRHAQHIVADDATHMNIALDHRRPFVDAVRQVVETVRASQT